VARPGTAPGGTGPGVVHTSCSTGSAARAATGAEAQFNTASAMRRSPWTALMTSSRVPSFAD
jgi:hypothetical protein